MKKKSTRERHACIQWNKLLFKKKDKKKLTHKLDHFQFQIESPPFPEDADGSVKLSFSKTTD